MMAGVRATRTLPPWIESYNSRLGVPSEEHLNPLEPQHPPSAVVPQQPPSTVLAQHNSHPSDPHRPTKSRGSAGGGSSSGGGGGGGPNIEKKATTNNNNNNNNHQPSSSPDGYRADSTQNEKLPLKHRSRNLQQFFTGKKPSQWDHLRSADPVIVPNRAPESHQSWRDFIASSSYGGHQPNEHWEIVDDDVLDKLQPGLNNPARLPSSSGGENAATKSGGGGYWLSLPGGPPSSSRHHHYNHRRGGGRPSSPPPAFFERLLLVPVRHPLGPLMCRLTVLSTSIIALALAGTIVQQSGADGSEERGQAIFAVAVDVVAIPYIGYIMWDDNLGKPLGLRPPKDRVKLILMDLFFIMFKAASTGLAFETLIYSRVDTSLRLLRALAAFELVGLVSWALTLIANVFRVVERLGG